MGVRAKLFINAGIVILCIILVGAGGMFFTSRVANVSLSLFETQEPINNLNQIEELAWKILLKIVSHAGMTDPEIMETLDKEIEKLNSKLISELRKYDDKKSQHIITFEKEWNLFFQISREVLNASHGYAKEYAMTMMAEDGKDAFDKVLSVLHKMTEEHEHHRTLLRDQAIHTQKQSTTILTTFIGIGFVISVFGSGLTVRSVTLPINQIVEDLKSSGRRSKLVAEQTSNSGKLLAETTGRQASSLEQISASIEQISAMTRQNARNADHAACLTKQVQDIVKKADHSMANLKNSMKDISQVSRKTRGIVKNMNEIASQTNLLALNAAIEAARAGEVGLGFGVVAEEVRNLALRSSEFARDTNSLLGIVTNKIGDVNDLTDQTFADFSQVTGSMIKTSALVGEIAVASAEQSQGIDQVSGSINDMEKMTLANASNAQETASVSEEMNVQSNQTEQFIEQLVMLITGKKKN